MKISEVEIEAIRAEISTSQSRVMQTLVPTVLAVGIMARAEVSITFMLCYYAVLLTTSIYVFILSNKIFRNATFLEVFSADSESKNVWMTCLDLLHDKSIGGRKSHVCCSETFASAVAYFVLTSVFVALFWTAYEWLVIGMAVFPFLVSFSIGRSHFNVSKFRDNWERVLVKAKNGSTD